MKLAILIGALLLALSSQGASKPIAFAKTPTLIENPSGRVPLAAEIRFATDAAVDVSLTIDDGERSWSAPAGTATRNGDQYSIPVIGMRPEQNHEITLVVSREGYESHRQTFQHRTPTLPLDRREFPTINVITAETERMEPGVTFLSVRRRAIGRPHWLTEKQRRFSTDWGMLAALNNEGEVIWYYRTEFRTAGIDRLSNGNLLMHRTDSSTVEIDLLGNTIRQFYAEGRPYPPPENPNAVAIKGMQTLHHQPHQLPDGDFLAFSANAFEAKNWWSSEIDPKAPRKDQLVMADTVVILTPQGDITWSWDTLDVMDTNRIGRDTFWSYWWVRGFPQHMDWTHGNGLSYDESDDSILVSLRNQSAILKVDRKTKALKWILARHDRWAERLRDKLLTPVGELMWPAYQHNPRMTHAGTVILFDNRVHGGALAFEDVLPLHKSFSRGVEYQIDEENMTVRQVWTSGDTQKEDACYANAMSDAWRLPNTDNRLLIYAFCLPLVEGATQDSMDETRRAPAGFPYGGRIEEYAGDDVVFRIELEDIHDLQQWEMYGGFRSPGIYHDEAAGSSH